MKKEKTLTPEQIARKNILSHRLLWLLIIIDSLLLVYIIIQVVFLIIK